MRVQIAGRTQDGLPNAWAVVDDTGLPHVEASRFLNYRKDIESSPNTLRAYARDVAYYLTFLDEHGLDLDDASNEVLARFAHWLRAPAIQVVAITDEAATLRRTSVNRTLAAIASLYTFLASGGEGASGHRGFKRLQDTASLHRRPDVTVLDNVGNARRRREMQRLGPRLPRESAHLRVLTIQQVHSILEACRNHQERLFFLLAFTTGMRIGQILGLRHEDLDTRARTVTIHPRDNNANGARAKTRKTHALPVTREVTRLYSLYMHEEYGFIDSDYIFIRMTHSHQGKALRPGAIYDAVGRIKSRTGIIDWTPHTLRHTFVTLQQAAGVPIDVISHLVTHANIHTTVNTYSHLSVAQLRETLLRHGAWEEE